MELISALKTGSEAISLTFALAELIKDTKANGPKAVDPQNSSLSEVLSRLQIDAVRLSRDLENRLRNVADHIQEYGLNPAKSLKQQFENLTSFLDDATAVLICANQQHLAAKAFTHSLESKGDLDRLFLDPETTLGTLVEGMLATASRATANLLAA